VTFLGSVCVFVCFWVFVECTRCTVFTVSMVSTATCRGTCGIGDDAEEGDGAVDALAMLATSGDVWRRVFQDWSFNAERGVDALQRCAMERGVPCGRAWPWEMSLLDIAASTANHCERLVVLVQWSDPSKWTGRRVEVRDGFAIYPMRRVETFVDPRVVHPAIGVHIRKSKVDRAAVPRWVERLKHMTEVSLGGGIALDACFICGDECGTDPASADAGTVCPLCLRASHSNCCTRFVAHDEFSKELQEMPPPMVHIGSNFSGTAVCAACQQWVSTPVPASAASASGAAS
jgi:hypothetical protein